MPPPKYRSYSIIDATRTATLVAGTPAISARSVYPMKAGTAVSTPTADGGKALISLTYTPGVRRFLKFGSAITLLLVLRGAAARPT
jgi:hypothetical protein